MQIKLKTGLSSHQVKSSQVNSGSNTSNTGNTTTRFCQLFGNVTETRESCSTSSQTSAGRFIALR